MKYPPLWPQKDSSEAGDDKSAWASIHDGGWSAAAEIETGTGDAGGDDTLGLLFDGSDFVAAWVEDTFSSTGASLWTNAFSGGAWGTAEQLVELADSSFSNDDPLPFALQGNRASAAWFEQPDDDAPVAVNVAIRNGAWDSPVDVATTPRGYSVEGGQLISNDAGQTPALWRQPRAGQIAIYAALQGTGGRWSDAELLTLGDWSVESAACASAFAVVYNETDPVSGATLLTGRIHDGTGWGAPADLGAGLAGNQNSPKLASNGSGFAVAWQRRTNGPDPSEIHATTWEDGAWAAPRRIDNIAADTNQSVSIASTAAAMPSPGTSTARATYRWQFTTAPTGSSSRPSRRPVPAAACNRS